MPNLQFPCPSCTQTIECEEQYAGLELTCPMCQAAVVAPAAPEPVAAPTVSTATAPKKNRLSVSASAAHTAHAAAPQTQSHQVYVPPPKKPFNKGPIIKVAVALVVICAGGYFGWPYIKKAQAKFSSKVDEAGAGSGGGELGHLADLNATLDATEPSKHETLSGSYGSAVGQAQQVASAGQPKPSVNLPSIPPTYTLSADETEIPSSKLNGSVAGHEFIPDLVRFDRVGQNYVLTLRQGTNGVPDRELFIYLRNTSKGYETNTLLVAKEFKVGNPQIVKKWKTGPLLFGQKTFSAGYVMKLEFDKVSNGSLPGKIYVALPDPEKTVVAGHFTAETTIGGPTP